MLYNLIYRRSRECLPIVDDYQKLVFDNVENDGKIVRVSTFKPSDAKSSLAKFTANDFSLSNILALGAYDMLKPTFAASFSNLVAADMVEASLNSLSNVKKQEK